MSASTDALVQTVSSQSIKINDDINITLDEDIKQQINAVENTEHVDNACHSYKNGDISKNATKKTPKAKYNKSKHKRKIKSTTAENRNRNEEPKISKSEAAEQDANSENKQDVDEHFEQNIKTSSSKSKKETTKKSRDADFVIEDEEKKSKPKCKSRLSLNSEVKNKNKFKEDNNQGTIMSFFQKLSPRTQDDNKNIKKEAENVEKESTSAIEESQENSVNKLNHRKEAEKLIVNNLNKEHLVRIKNKKENAENISTLLEENQNLIRENDERNNSNADKNSRKKKKSKSTEAENKSKNIKHKKKSKESSTNKDTTNKKQKIVSSTSFEKKKINSSTVDDLAHPTNGENNMQEEIGSDGDNQIENSNGKEHKKVRFSEHIKEFSPEPVQKNSKSHKNGPAAEQLKYNENEVIKNNVEAQNTNINIDEESSGSSKDKIGNNKNINEQAQNKIRNAFTFMMDSRNKSIGQNSSGKEQEKLEESPELHKEIRKKRSVRKAIFEEWADAKGAKKRKIVDEETGIVIENKLKKRAKRLKKMLTERDTPDTLSVEDSQHTSEIVVKKHKITRIIESDSEYTCDSDLTVPIEEPEDSSSVSITCLEQPNRKKEKRKRKSDIKEKISKQENDVAPVDDHALDEEIFFKHKKPKLLITSDSSNSETNVISENKQKNNLKKTISGGFLQQIELSSFFGLLNKTENSEVTINKNKSKLQLKQNAKNSEDNSKKQKNNKKKNNIPSKLALKKNEDSNATITSDDFSNSYVEMETKNNTESVEKVIENLDNAEEGMKAEIWAVLTPRSIKQWKMKLKMSLEDLADEEIEKLILSPKTKINSDDDSEDIQMTRKKIKKVLVSSDSDSDDEPLSSKIYCKDNRQTDKSKSIKPVKLAPLFIKSKPKPKPPILDEAIIEARKNFLHSGIPDSLKKTIKKQQSVEEPEYQIFPTVSHVTIKPTNEQLASSDINFWDLPKVELQLTSSESYSPDISLLYHGAVTTFNTLNNAEVNLEVVQQITNVTNYLQKIKKENPNYPVYKAFRFLHQKYATNNTNEKKIPEIPKSETVTKKSKKGRPKKKKPSSLNDDVQIVDSSLKQPINLSKQEIWTDLYKPNTSEEIFGNYASICQFKKWLETWLEFSEEINVQRSRRKHRNSDSSDFEGIDDESKDSTRFPGNTLIFCGPHGSGKTTAVYALCNELGVNVLELNASSKRTGKRLLQELQEATQSHQVRKNDSNSLTTFLKKEETPSQNSQSSDSQSSTSSKKMCLLLIEDVDIVFEQDENFITALSQLLTTSKRPVVLTTTDINCLHLKKLIAQHPVITFSALTAKILATWLQVLCLIEGLHVDRQAIVELLERNKGDVRQTLLQLQFWVQSGGQLKISKEILPQISNASKRISCDENFCIDDSSNISWFNDKEDAGAAEQDITLVHSNCLESFGYFKNFNPLFTLLPLNLGDIWWNMSGLIKTPPPLKHKSEAAVRDSKNENKEKNVEEKSTPSNLDSQSSVKQDQVVENTTNTKNLQNVLNIFETLAMTDTMYEKLNVDCDLEPVHTNRDTRVKNSLELNECMESYCSSRDLAYEWSHALLDGYVNLYDVDEGTCKIEGCSIVQDKRWRTKQNKCSEALLEAVPTICHLDHNSVNIDYLSTLRTMARSEVVRASNNNKRRNRFYNYLRGIGICCNDSLFQTACNTFQHEN